MKKFTVNIILVAMFLFAANAAAQSIDEIKSSISDQLTEITRRYVETGRSKVKVKKVVVDSRSKRVVVEINDLLSYVPLRPENVREIYAKTKEQFPESQQSFHFKIVSNGNAIEDLIPNFYREKNIEQKRKFTLNTTHPLVKNTSKPFTITNGLQNRHIALWQSHGLYYEQKLARWEWQRARIFQTVEDLFTQSFVLPFLVPMLENAGANVFLPRERDTQINEVIVDNDGSTGDSKFIEETWHLTDDSTGFANPKAFYVEGENPFKMGTYRETKSTTNDDEVSYAEWHPDVPKTGEYAVYVSYKSFPHSVTDARYKIMHAGGETEFKVDQTMGGGTWIYLGTFKFNKGVHEKSGVTLSNKSDDEDRIVSADAVKFGGGMGNIARRPNPLGLAAENTKSSDQNANVPNLVPQVEYDYEISGYPRFTEGARYWMQWSGVPDTVYNRNENSNDYTDDYSSRGNWVNYLAGGSEVLPKDDGLHIPIDLSFAFHSDAGTVKTDSIIGTLGIFMSKKEKNGNRNNEKFENGVSRYASRDLTDLIMTNIVNDVRTTFHDEEWSRRGMWNKSYSEARVPEVPTMLLELLSHQNFADMRYGLDPRFRFVVSRAVYKGMLKFISSENNFDYVVEPLPVQQFSAEFYGESDVELKWQPTIDPLESSAMPTRYIVYSRIDDDDFDNGSIVDASSCLINIEPDRLYSFKITALNAGGESFPSEILSVYKNSKSQGTVLVVNGFDRVSAPASFQVDTVMGGFEDRLDHGVPYIKDISYIGSQHEFRREIPWMDDDSAGFGASDADYEKEVIAGNTFDYPLVHGRAIAKAGFSFVSCSAKAVENGQISLNKYSFIDLILGKQRQTKIGAGKDAPQFKTFSTALQNAITNYCAQGGNIFASGAFIASDLWDTDYVVNADKDFAQNVLKYKWRSGSAATNGEVKGVTSAVMQKAGQYTFNNTLNDSCYIVEAPDGIEPADNSTACTVFRYSENNLSAGVAYKGDIYKTCILGFPFETIRGEKERDDLMKKILEFFTTTQTAQTEE